VNKKLAIGRVAWYKEDAMTCIGKVVKGMVKLPPGVKLPDGTAVELILPETSKSKNGPAPKGGWFSEELKDFVGMIKEGPPDLAANHDHYAHGKTKRSKS
jgi:hypothetical protein